jgi:2-oxoglutarate ferredoxin oxidoreductase subunit beta
MSSAYKRVDFLSNVTPRWCPGCGCFGVLKSLTSMFANSGLPREQFVTVSGIGCSARLPYYLGTYGMHSIHGRAPTIATGIKMVNPDLSVWVITGDGDALAIGGNHTMHFMRRNPDIKMILLNNQVYGLTKGQSSPTSPKGMKTKTSPGGTEENPIKPLNLALAMGATFVARVSDKDNPMIEEVLEAARLHKGAALVEVLLNCITFHDGAFEPVSNKDTRDDHSIRLEHGQPMVFGSERDKGLRRRADGRLEVVSLSVPGISEEDILVHDQFCEDPAIAQQLSLMSFPDEPYALGIFRQVLNEEPVAAVQP